MLKKEDEKSLQKDLELDDQILLSEIFAIDIMAGVEDRKAIEKASNTMSEIKKNIGSYKIDREPRKRPEEVHYILNKIEVENL